MSTARPDFVVFSDDWGRHPSSCQHLFHRIAQGHRVLWVNTIGMRGARADRFTLLRGLEKLGEWSRPLRRAGERLWVLSPVMLPVMGNGVLGRVNRAVTAGEVRWAMRQAGICRPILWVSVPNGGDYVGRLGERGVVYYVTDDYRCWPGGDSERIGRADEQLTKRSDVVFACTDALAASYAASRRPTVVQPHGVDFEYFARPRPEPPDLSVIPGPPPCFFSLIYEKIGLLAQGWVKAQ